MTKPLVRPPSIATASAAGRISLYTPPLPPPRDLDYNKSAQQPALEAIWCSAEKILRKYPVWWLFRF